MLATSASLPDGQVVGGMVAFPVADGYAWYKVVSAKPLKLQHVPFGDGWHADPITLRGLRFTDVNLMLWRQRAMFAKS